MITDPEELLSKMFRAVREMGFGYRKDPLRLTEESHDACIDLIKQYEIHIRTESVEQAMKDAADRAVYFYERDCGGCGKNVWEKCGECSHTKDLRAAILGENVKEGKTDAEKLAIAVNALEYASISIAKTDGDYDTLCVIRHALKEIHYASGFWHGLQEESNGKQADSSQEN